jgi:uncharacterized protein YggE
METLEENKKRLFQAGIALLIILSVYYAVKIFSEIKKDSLLGESATPATISFSGHGEVSAVPDIANIYFTISKDAETIKDAQAGVAVIEKSALDLLKAKGVDAKDIQTADASFNPKYEYKQAVCPPSLPTPIPLNGGVSSGSTIMSPVYCNPGKQIIVGYTASESITVKVRNVDNVGDIMQGLGATGVFNLNGPDFAIDNPDALQVQARKLAIDDAKAKGQVLAKDLGVSLGKIESFSDDNANGVIYAPRAEAISAGAVSASAPAMIPKGQNTITSDVTITYEIK